MIDIENQSTIENKQTFPQHLCKMCGRCCKSITTLYTPEELNELSNKGSKDAKVFIDIFKKFDNIEEAKKVVPEQVMQVLNELDNLEKHDKNNHVFYYCPHITKDNLCSIHQDRPDCCKRAPQHGWSCMPPGCGFEGWQFEERERIKSRVRKLKEYLLSLEALSKSDNTLKHKQKVEEVRKTIEQKISPWKKYGADFW